ncbi:hypothetical protein ABT160_23730 [Streptomyces sp. NPDC001941]|uniref:hypothetical protein n=1 Tax=Streptomyces sp. NPDC001941 TaxID=3154659 RepID=UPI0033234E46
MRRVPKAWDARVTDVIGLYSGHTLLRSEIQSPETYRGRLVDVELNRDQLASLIEALQTRLTVLDEEAARAGTVPEPDADAAAETLFPVDDQESVSLIRERSGEWFWAKILSDAAMRPTQQVTGHGKALAKMHASRLLFRLDLAGEPRPFYFLSPNGREQAEVQLKRQGLTPPEYVPVPGVPSPFFPPLPDEEEAPAPVAASEPTPAPQPTPRRAPDDGPAMWLEWCFRAGAEEAWGDAEVSGPQEAREVLYEALTEHLVPTEVDARTDLWPPLGAWVVTTAARHVKRGKACDYTSPLISVRADAVL